MKRGVLFSLLMLFSSTALSAEGVSITLKASSFYLGGGVGFNTASGGNGTGIQILGGYQFDFKINGNISTALELGYMDSGNFDTKNFNNDATFRVNDKAKGMWLNVVESFPIGNRVEGLVRLGIDFGDDDGVMAGTGLGYYFNPNWVLRSEYVVRDNVNSFQFNLLYNF
ncbi:MAG: outer membrane beta-barrel protein [Gammaproteobacteria bacterium]|jgi:hypothetical protein